MRGVLVVESSTTCCMSSTGGSTKREPRLFTMKEVAQNDTLSGRRERTNSMRCSSLHALSHSPENTVNTCKLQGEQNPSLQCGFTETMHTDPSFYQSITSNACICSVYGYACKCVCVCVCVHLGVCTQASGWVCGG